MEAGEVGQEGGTPGGEAFGSLLLLRLLASEVAEHVVGLQQWGSGSGFNGQ